MMVAVFNSPMATGDTQQVFRGCSILGQAGESEGVIIANLTAFQVKGGALDQECLPQMGEVYARCPCSDGDFAIFKTAMSDISRFGAEGKNPPKGGIAGCCAAFAGSL